MEALKPDEEKPAAPAQASPQQQSSAAALRRGRLITLAGVLLLCFDTPIIRLEVGAEAQTSRLRQSVLCRSPFWRGRDAARLPRPLR